MKNTPKQFETKRLILRETNLEDKELVIALMNSPKWLKYIGNRNVKLMEEAEAYINEHVLASSNSGNLNYTVLRKIDHAKIGICGLYDREGIDGVDLGFAFLEEFEKQGYGKESALKVKEVAFSILNNKKVSAITTPENRDSKNLLEKIGFNYIKKISLPNSKDKLLLYESLK